MKIVLSHFFRAFKAAYEIFLLKPHRPGHPIPSPTALAAIFGCRSLGAHHGGASARRRGRERAAGRGGAVGARCPRRRAHRRRREDLELPRGARVDTSAMDGWMGNFGSTNPPAPSLSLSLSVVRPSVPSFRPRASSLTPPVLPPRQFEDLDATYRKKKSTDLTPTTKIAHRRHHHQARSIHWFPYDRVGVVNADP